MRPVDPCSLSSRHVFYFTLDNPLLLSHSPRLANPAICPSLSGSRGIPEACTRERKEWGREQENGEEKRQGETSVLIRKGCTFQDWNHQAGCVPWQTCFRLPLSCRSVWGCKRTRCVCVRKGSRGRFIHHFNWKETITPLTNADVYRCYLLFYL